MGPTITLPLRWPFPGLSRGSTYSSPFAWEFQDNWILLSLFPLRLPVEGISCRRLTTNILFRVKLSISHRICQPRVGSLSNSVANLRNCLVCGIGNISLLCYFLPQQNYKAQLLKLCLSYFFGSGGWIRKERRPGYEDLLILNKHRWCVDSYIKVQINSFRLTTHNTLEDVCRQGILSVLQYPQIHNRSYCSAIWPCLSSWKPLR